MGKLSALELAKYITAKTTDEKISISNLQLQKIMFYLQRDYLKKYNETLFNDHIEAWKFGPVVKDVYYRYSSYGASKIINNNIQDLSILEDSGLLCSDIKSIDDLIIELAKSSPWDLVARSHKKGEAWDKTYRKSSRGKIEIGYIIKDES